MSLGDPDLSVSVLKTQLQDTQAKFIICYDGSRKKVFDALKDCDLLGKIQVIVLEKSCPSLEEDWPIKEEGFIFFNDFVRNAEKLIQPPVLQDGAPNDNDNLIIFWSSGTTGSVVTVLQFHSVAVAI